MKENYFMGHMAYHVFFGIAAVAVLFADSVTGKFLWELEVGAVAGVLITELILKQIRKRGNQTEWLYSRIQIVTFTGIMLLLSYAFDNGYLLLFLMFLQTFLTFLFMDRRLCVFHNVLVFLVVMAVGASGFPGISRKPARFEYISAILVLMVIFWMMSNIIKGMQFQHRKNFEQERSLDDLLKVVEAKCDEARKATKSKSEFLSNMSHEIRTPINAVLGMNEMILRESRDPQIMKYAANIESSGNMLLSLINDILDFSKIESGKMEIIPVEYQLSSVLNDLVNMINPRVKDKGLKIEVEVNTMIPNYLYGDEVRIRQVVTNLLTNAVKYTDDGVITLKVDYESVASKEIRLLFAVKDTGRGIKEEDIDKLFQSFQRVDQKNNRNIEGTGLGLSITSRFVEMMKGTIDVKSSYGEGSVFSVLLPQTVTRKEEIGDFKEKFQKRTMERENYKESFHAPKARVLVVDDNSMNLTVVEGLLKQTKVQLETVCSGIECLERLRENSYDILLLDHMMPHMDGVQTLAKIKQEGLGKGMPVIALTANAVSGAREMYLDYGFQDYLSKPIVGKSLEKLLRIWLPEELIEVSVQEKKDETSKQKKVQSEAAEGCLADSQPDRMRIDHETAMLYSGGSEELYQNLLKAYYRQGEKYRSEMRTYYEKQDWENYRILVHAIKSTSLSIGAAELSEEAKQQEMAAKAGNAAIIKESFENFCQHYEQVLAEVENLLKG